MLRVLHLGALVALALVAAAGASAAGPSVFRGPGIVLPTPTGWYVSNEPLTPSISEPVQRFVLASYRVPAGGADSDGDYAPPPGGVIAQLDEDVPSVGGGFPPRPQQFRLPRLGKIKIFGGTRWGEILFRDHGRHFYIFIGVGRRASPAKVGLLLHALDGMTITSA